MDDVLKSIKAFLYERSVSPLFGAFVLSWSIWNYRVLIIAFSSSGFENKLSALNSYFSPIAISTFGQDIIIPGSLLNGVVLPSIITILYIFVYPLLAAPVYQHSLKKQTQIREIKQAAENERLLSASESRELFKQLSTLQEKYDSERESYEKRIRSLSETIRELETNASNLGEKEFNDLKKSLNAQKEKQLSLSKSLEEKNEIITSINKHTESLNEKLTSLENKNKSLTQQLNKPKEDRPKYKDPDLTENEIEQLMFVGDLGGHVHLDRAVDESPFKRIVASRLMHRLKDKNYVNYWENENEGTTISLSEQGVSKLLNFEEYTKRKKTIEHDNTIPF